MVQRSNAGEFSFAAPELGPGAGKAKPTVVSAQKLRATRREDSTSLRAAPAASVADVTPPRADPTSNPPFISLARGACSSSRLTLTLLVIVAFASDCPLVLVGRDGCSLPGLAAAVGERHASLALAEIWGQQLYPSGTSTHANFAAEFGEGALAVADIVRVIALPMTLLTAPGGFCSTPTDIAARSAEIDRGPIFCELSALVDSELYLPCAAAMHVVSVFRASVPRVIPETETYDGPPGADAPIGAPVVGQRRLARLSDAVPDGSAWACMRGECELTDASLRAALGQILNDDPDADYLLNCIDRVGASDCAHLNDVPPALRGGGADVSNAALADLAFSARFSPSTTAPWPPPTQPFVMFTPMSITDILLPEAITMINDWFEA